MKFLTGLFTGALIAAGLMTWSDTRETVLEGLSHLSLPQPPPPSPTASLIGRKTAAGSARTGSAESTQQDATEPEPHPSTLIPVNDDDDSVRPAPVKDEQPEPASPAPETRYFQVAWSPFRSEASARGFARHLQVQTGHEFRVLKAAPGKYEVGFAFDTEEERTTRLDAVRQLTGYANSTEPDRIH